MLSMEHLWVVFFVRYLIIRFSATGPTFFLWFSVDSYDIIILAPTTIRVKRKLTRITNFPTILVSGVLPTKILMHPGKIRRK